MNEAFNIFFKEKRIDLKAFRESRKELCEELEKIFVQIGPQSFDQQKKFLFNPLRLDFPLDTPILEKSKPAKANPALRKKPVFVSRPVNKGPEEKENTTQKKKKAPPLKRPLMKPKDEGNPQVPPLKKPLMKKKEVAEEGAKQEKKKPPPLKRPLKRPIMKKKEGKPKDPEK